VMSELDDALELSDLARVYFCDQPAPTGKCRQDVVRPS
jgi:hypothetical protein